MVRLGHSARWSAAILVGTAALLCHDLTTLRSARVPAAMAQRTCRNIARTIYLPYAYRTGREGPLPTQEVPLPRCGTATPTAIPATKTPTAIAVTATPTGIFGTGTPTATAGSTTPTATAGTGTATATSGTGTATATSGTTTPTAIGGTGTASPTTTIEWTPTPRPASETPTLIPTPTHTPTMTPTAKLPVETAFGVQAFESDLDAVVTGRLNSAGLNWVRARALWPAVEPRDATPRVREWGMTDAIITTAAAKGLRLIVVVYDNPAWAATTTCGMVDKVPLSRYGDFLRDLVERYDGDGQKDAAGSPRVDYWEITNEPDFNMAARAQHPDYGDPPQGYGGCFGDKPAAYGDLLREAHKAVKAADPTAKVVFGPVAYDRFTEHETFMPRGPFSYTFVKDVLTSTKSRFGSDGAWPFFDVMAFHNYNDFRNNWDGPDGRDPEIVGKSKHLRENQLKSEGVFDLSDAPMLASEMGIPSGPTDPYTERSEVRQAAYVGQVMIRSMAAELPIAIWFTLGDYATGDCNQIYDWLAYGLLRTRPVADRLAQCNPSPLPGYQLVGNHEPKPAHKAMGVLSNLIAGAVYERQLTAAETGSPDLEAHRLTLLGGRKGLVAFTDHGERLGKLNLPDPERDLVLDSTILPGWTGRVRVVDYMGGSRMLSGQSVTIHVTYQPSYVLVEP